MPRPRAYVPRDVVRQAQEAFWEGGYEGTAMSELERRTGLNRSSLYLAFESKRGLFGAALDSYMADVVDPLLAPMESGPPGLEAIVAFFSGVKAIILDERGQRRRGCLMVNTVAELSSRDEDAERRAAAFRDRLRRAFARALEGAAPGELAAASVPRQARMLTAATLGIWLCARIDPIDAGTLCDEVTLEVEASRSPEAAGRSLPPEER